jgi:hypothetical protein
MPTKSIHEVTQRVDCLFHDAGEVLDSQREHWCLHVRPHNDYVIIDANYLHKVADQTHLVLNIRNHNHSRPYLYHGAISGTSSLQAPR